MVSAIIFSCIIIICLEFSYSLVELPRIDSNAILVTASIIRDTINNLFRTLKLNKTKDSRITEYSTLHKYFEALTLEDYKTLNEIVKVTRVYYSHINNATDLVATINDLLEEDDTDFNSESEVIENSVNVITYIEIFLYNLQRLKEAFRVDNVYVDINKDVLELLKGKNIKTVNDSRKESITNKSDEYDVMDENEFWEPSGRRIFKGERTKIRHFPFVVTILIFNNFYCAGSIIKSDLVITASSCLQLAWNNRFYRENPAFLSVRVGSSFYDGGGEVVPVLEIYFHPGYNPKNLRNNICILRLARKLKFRRRTRRLKKIDFDRHDSNLPLTTYGITVVGWGAKQHSSVIGNPWTNIISYAVLDVYSLQDCQDVYSREYVTMKNFCAGFISRGGGACNRDVGGPGIVEGKLMGIISFGSPVCGMPDAPTVFTKVGYYTDWIEEIMEQNVPVSKKRTTLKPLNTHYTVNFNKPSKPTTFKILPINGKTMRPIPIAQIDSQLRILDEEVFKDFLATMFNSKEINDYKDILIDYVGNTLTNNTGTENKIDKVTEEFKPVTETTTIIEPHTLLTEGSPESSESNKPDVAYTVMDQENINVYNNEVAQLIDEELEKVTKAKVPKKSKVSKTAKDKKIRNETITLLYLSDNDKKLVHKNYNNEDEGMSIPNDVFKDLTRTGGSNNEVLPESALYELLSEVIREEVENIGDNILR